MSLKDKLKDFWHWKIHNPWFFFKLRLPKTKRKYAQIKTVAFWSNRLQEFNFGHLVLNKVTFVITIVNFIILISLKWDFDPLEYIAPIALLSAFLIWYVGRALEKRGFRKYFVQAQFKDVKIK